MKKNLISLFIICSVIQFAFAQNSSITVFSPDGDRLYVVLDGIRQNDTPLTNVKITDLDRPNYVVKVIFENAMMEDIDQNVMLQDYDGNSLEVVYSIRLNKKGVLDMRVSSFNEVQTRPTKEENVVKYHAIENTIPKVSVIPIENSRTVTTTTTTTTTPGTTENVNINMGFGTGINTSLTENGENVNINMNIGGFNTNTGTTTTTQHISSTTSSSSTNITMPVAPVVEKGCVNPMNGSDFSAAKTSVSKQSFADSQMKTAMQFTKVNCLSVNQIKEMMGLFSFEDDKLDYAKYAYDFCTDKNKYFMLAEEFSFSSNADSLNDFIDKK
jgi:hypothetical protein